MLVTYCNIPIIAMLFEGAEMRNVTKMSGDSSDALQLRAQVLHGMFNPSQVNLAADPEFFNDIHADVEQECSKRHPTTKCPSCFKKKLAVFGF